MRMLLLLLLLAGCASNAPADGGSASDSLQPGSFGVRLNGRYDALGGVVQSH